jgi:hypothetical protein
VSEIATSPGLGARGPGCRGRSDRLPPPEKSQVGTDMRRREVKFLPPHYLEFGCWEIAALWLLFHDRVTDSTARRPERESGLILPFIFLASSL